MAEMSTLSVSMMESAAQHSLAAALNADCAMVPDSAPLFPYQPRPEGDSPKTVTLGVGVNVIFRPPCIMH